MASSSSQPTASQGPSSKESAQEPAPTESPGLHVAEAANPRLFCLILTNNPRFVRREQQVKANGRDR